MARVDALEADVLISVAAKLRTDLSLGVRQAFVVLDPRNPPQFPKGGNYFITVAPGGGVFAEGDQVYPNVTEETEVLVTAYTRVLLDSTDHYDTLLTQATRGLLPIKRSILKSLVGADLQIGGDSFTRDAVFAIRAERPDYDESKSIGWQTITFGVNFDWDLS